jgi:hypothetical protein
VIALVATVTLGVAATGTAVCMSVIGAWQRGGWLGERLVWVAVSVVLIFGVHLLPGLVQDRSRPLRCIGSVLWAIGLATACYGHATFFLFSMSHAGEGRAAALISSEDLASIPPPVNSGNIAQARADVIAKLARLDSQRCISGCETVRARQAALQARIVALDAQAEDARRAQA